MKIVKPIKIQLVLSSLYMSTTFLCSISIEVDESTNTKKECKLWSNKKTAAKRIAGVIPTKGCIVQIVIWNLVNENQENYPVNNLPIMLVPWDMTSC